MMILLLMLLIVGAFFFLYIIASKHRFSKETLTINNHEKRNKCLHTKVLQLFEIEAKHQRNIKILEEKVEQLQNEIALKHKP